MCSIIKMRFIGFVSFAAYLAVACSVHAASLPSAQDDGRYPTLNKMGWAINSIDPYTQEFINFAAQVQRPVLEIGAAYGFATHATLKANAVVIANDLEPKHLQILQDITAKELRDKLILMPGRFPEELHFTENSLGAILVSRVFHFFDDQELELAAATLYKWLMVGGKAYIITESTYLKPWQKFISVYEARKKANNPWPGLLKEPAKYNSKSAAQLPKYIHFMDPDILSRVFTKVGFKVEKVGFISRTDFPLEVQLDGRESVGIIVVKE